MTMQNPWAGFLEEEPKTGYFSYGDRFAGPSGSQRQGNFFQNQFNNIYDLYLGRLGTQIRQGLAPTEKWNDFLGGFDFNKWYRDQTTAQERNPQQNQLVPETTWRVNPWLNRGMGG